MTDHAYRMAPELTVSNLEASLHFWCDLIGFEVAYARKAEGFAFLSLGPLSLMMEQADRADRQWLTGALEHPFGRGVNFEVTVPDGRAPLARLNEAEWPLFMAEEVKTYRVGGGERTVRQFLVQDPDGYLLRIAQVLAES